MLGYYSIGEIVEPAQDDWIWQEYGLPSLVDLGGIAFKQNRGLVFSILGIGVAAAAVIYCANKGNPELL